MPPRKNCTVAFHQHLSPLPILRKPEFSVCSTSPSKCPSPITQEVRYLALRLALPPDTILRTDSARRGLGIRRSAVRGPLHDPNEDGAVVLYRPPPLSAADAANPDIRNKHPVAVVVDPLLGRKLRPHQVEGVQFLYRCMSAATARARHVPS